MYSLLYSFFAAAAWPMSQPVPGGSFHLFFTFFGLTGALGTAFLFCRLSPFIPPKKVLFGCGLLLLLAEFYKQGFLFFIVHGGSFNWWYFPFQLCSIPMYLCLLYPVAERWGLSGPLAVFLQDFGLLGGIMALIVPDGFLWPYWILTLHGFLWHFMLVFLSLYCRFTGLSGSRSSSFFQCLPIYFLCAGTAVLINTGVQLSVYPEGYADMFYINCFFPSEQPVFSEISLALGNIWGHLAYLLASCIGAGVIHLFYSFPCFTRGIGSDRQRFPGGGEGRAPWRRRKNR